MEGFEASGLRKILQIIFLCKESPAENLNFADEPHWKKKTEDGWTAQVPFIST